MESDDEALVARVVSGDTGAFEQLMRRHNRRVFHATRAILGNDDDAEDAMQDAYVAAFTHLRDFAGRSRFATWLVRIAVNEALARLRRSKRLVSIDDTGMEDAMALRVGKSESPEDAASDVEVRGLLEEAVDALPLGFRAVFMMRAVEEMSVEETAQALSIPEETVRTRLHRARGLLREDLARKIDGAAPRAFDFHLSRCDRVVAAVLSRLKGTGT